MKLCPLCHLCYEEAETSCANDQSPLVSSHPGTRLVAKKYRLDWLLGRGCLGALYEGTHIATDRCVAVRLLAPDCARGRETLKQFRAEAHTVAHLNTRIDHQHVAKTCDYGTLTDGTPYIVTELLTWTPLRDFMAGAGALTVSDAVRVARQMADGLEAAHRCGVVHGDLNPSNIFVTQDRRGRLDVKMLDFGYGRLRALLMTGDDGGSRHESPAISPYLPPEQKLGRRSDERSDLYGLGMILYELLAGRPHLLQATQVCEGAGPGELTPLTELREDVPEPLWRLVEQSVATKPSARPANAGEFKRRLMGLGGPGQCERSVDFVPDAQVAMPQEGGAVHPALSFVHAAELEEFTPSLEAQERGQDAGPAGALLCEEAAVVAEAGGPVRAVAAAPGEGEAKWRLRAHGSSYLAAFRARLGAISSGLGNVGNHINIDNARGVFVVAVISLAAMLLGSLTGMLIVSSLGPSTPDAAPSALMRKPTEADSTASAHPAASPSAPPEDIPRPAGEDEAAVAHGNPSTGGLGAVQQAQAEPGLAKPVPGASRSERSALRAVLDNWLAATNQRDLEKQINLYTKKVDTFYGKRNASREVVRDHKSRLFTGARSIEMRASEPEISLGVNGQRATMRFRKKWVIKGKRNSRGEATQELALLKTDSGWKIIGERNVEGAKARPESKKAEQAHER